MGRFQIAVLVCLVALATTAVSADSPRQIALQVAAALDGVQPQAAVDLTLADQSLNDAIAAAPEYAPAYVALGRLKLAQADYFSAAAAFNRAQVLSPFDQQARSGLAEAKRLSDLLIYFPLPYPRRVFRLAEVPDGQTPGAFLLIGTLSVWGPDLWSVQTYLLDPEVRYYTWHGAGYEEAFRTQGVAGAGFENPGEVTFARAWVGDYQQTGRSQVLLVTGWVGADWIPTYLDIFEAAGGAMRQVLHVDSAFPPQLVDLDGDGRVEVQTSHPVGATMPRAEAGTWFDLYAYDGQEYVRANERYPEFAQDQLQRLLDLDAQYPDDYDVLGHLAQAYTDVGQPENGAPYAQWAQELGAAAGAG
jgi:tetratricopeptide (TPR) repeat protein